MELWELQAILDIELSKAEAERDYRLIEELKETVNVKDWAVPGDWKELYRCCQ